MKPFNIPVCSHTVVGRLRGAVGHEELDRVVEPQPLRDPHRQPAFALQLLIDQEIIPVGVVLDRGHAVGCRILERQQDRPPSQLRCGGRNMLLNEIQGSVLAHNSGKIAGGIVVKLAARRIRSLAGHS